MTKEELEILKFEIAKTYELYGFEVSFSEFKDIFELGATFGYALAKMSQNDDINSNNSANYNVENTSNVKKNNFRVLKD